MGYVIDLVDWYREVLRDNPDSEMFVLLAEALRFDGRWAEAVDTCREALEKHPHNLRARVVLGVCLAQLGESGESRKVLECARQELEKNVDMYDTLSRLAMEVGDTELAQRFSEIYRNMRPLAPAESPQPVETKSESAEQPEESAGTRVEEKVDQAPMPRPPRHEELLCSWLEKCEQKRESPPASVELFSDSERDLLRRLLLKPGHQ